MSQNPTVNLTAFATRVRRSRVVRLSWSSRIFLQPAASKIQASNSSDVSTFLQQASVFVQPHKQRYNAVRSVHSDSSISANVHSQTHVRILNMTETVTFQNVDLSTSNTCIYVLVFRDNGQTWQLALKFSIFHSGPCSLYRPVGTLQCQNTKVTNGGGGQGAYYLLSWGLKKGAAVPSEMPRDPEICVRHSDRIWHCCWAILLCLGNRKKQLGAAVKFCGYEMNNIPFTFWRLSAYQRTVPWSSLASAVDMASLDKLGWRQTG